MPCQPQKISQAMSGETWVELPYALSTSKRNDENNLIGNLMSGVLIFRLVFNCFSKKQNTVETASEYGFEFLVDHQATEPIIGHPYTLRILGILIDGGPAR
jgi:hypothetical protein